MKNMHASEVSERVTEMLLQEMDPRVHPETKAFFEQLKPEVADRIAEFYNHYHKTLLTMAFKYRDAIELFESECSGPVLDEVAANAKTFFFEFVQPNRMRGYDEVSPLIGALRGYTDDGLNIALYEIGYQALNNLLTDDGLGALIERLVYEDRESQTV